MIGEAFYHLRFAALITRFRRRRRCSSEAFGGRMVTLKVTHLFGVTRRNIAGACPRRRRPFTQPVAPWLRLAGDLSPPLRTLVLSTSRH